MKPGWKATEAWGLLGVFIFALLVSFGVLTPERVSNFTNQIGQTTETIPLLIESIKELIESLGPLATFAGLAWAYLKRRSGLKAKELSLKETNND